MLEQKIVELIETLNALNDTITNIGLPIEPKETTLAETAHKEVQLDPLTGQPVQGETTQRPPPGSQVTKDHVIAALTKVLQSHELGAKAASMILSRFGVKTVPDLPESQYVEVVKKCAEVLKGGEI